MGSAKSKSQATGVTAVKIYLSIAAILAGAIVGLYLVVPIMKHNCVWFTTRCDRITIKVGPDNSLLIIDKRTGFTYYYDGNAYLFAYGDNLPGSCPTIEGVNVTGDLVPISKTLPPGTACLRVAAGDVCEYPEDGKEHESTVLEDGTLCCELNTEDLTPAQYTGSTLAKGKDVFQPAFALDAKTMTLVDGNILCARVLQDVAQSLVDVRELSVPYAVPTGDSVLDIYQTMELLKKKGYFKPPE
jgi:hypothetical protein